MASSQSNDQLDKVQALLSQLIQAAGALPSPQREVLLADCGKVQADLEQLIKKSDLPDKAPSHSEPVSVPQSPPLIRIVAKEKPFALHVRDYLDQILEAANEIIWIVDANARTVYINPHGAQSLGFRVEEMLGKTPGEFMFPEDIEASYRVFEQRDNLHNEYRLRRKDGQQIWLLSATMPLYDEEKTFIGSLNISTDITRRREAEQALRTSKALLELHHHSVEQREMELARIAGEIERGPIQEVNSIALTMHVARDAVQDPEMAGYIDQGREQILHLLQELRAIHLAIHPPSAVEIGLKRAVQTHAEAYKKRHPELMVRQSLMEDVIRLPDAVSLALFQIYEESMKNVALHAQAAIVNVWLSLDAAQIQLVIEDDGKGFVVPRDPLELVQQGHFGLVSMREYAESVHGTLEIHSQPGSGTKVTATVPYNSPFIEPG